MREFDKYFQSEENLNNIFVDYSDIIESIDNYRKQFLAGIITTPQEYDTALDFFTAAYDSFDLLYQIACAYKESKEDAESLRLRNFALENKEKITDATVKISAHYVVKEYIKVRNVLLHYVNACEKYISTCQSKIKKYHPNKPQE